MRWVLRIVGVIMIALGGLWALQGVGVLPGSFMTGDSFWATAGLLLAIAGAVALFFGVRMRAVKQGRP